DINPRHLKSVLLTTYERAPADFAALLGVKGGGAATLRALSLISELLYGAPASTRDPARYSFAHGGKDGFPYPVDREAYDRSIEVLREAVARAKVGESERVGALKRLGSRTRNQRSVSARPDMNLSRS